jgi:hypothetical protein
MSQEGLNMVLGNSAEWRKEYPCDTENGGCKVICVNDLQYTTIS